MTQTTELRSVEDLKLEELYADLAQAWGKRYGAEARIETSDGTVWQLKQAFSNDWCLNTLSTVGVPVVTVSLTYDQRMTGMEYALPLLQEELEKHKATQKTEKKAPQDRGRAAIAAFQERYGQELS